MRCAPRAQQGHRCHRSHLTSHGRSLLHATTAGQQNSFSDPLAALAASPTRARRGSCHGSGGCRAPGAVRSPRSLGAPTGGAAAPHEHFWHRRVADRRGAGNSLLHSLAMLRLPTSRQEGMPAGAAFSAASFLPAARFLRRTSALIPLLLQPCGSSQRTAVAFLPPSLSLISLPSFSPFSLSFPLSSSLLFQTDFTLLLQQPQPTFPCEELIRRWHQCPSILYPRRSVILPGTPPNFVAGPWIGC